MEESLGVISRQICKYISKNNRSITATSELWGISRNELSAILNCKKDVKLSTLVKIADGIGCPVSCLISREEKKRRDAEDIVLRLYIDLKNIFREGDSA